MCRRRCLGTSPVRDCILSPGSWPEFELGSDVAVVSTVTSTAASDLKVIHHRPAVIQELTWRPRYGARRAASPDTESVEQVVFGFHDGRLFRVTVDYDREQTKGLVDADMVEAISAVYGPQVKPSVSRRRQAPSVYDDPGTPIAQWGNADNSVRSYRSSSAATSFRLVVIGLNRLLRWRARLPHEPSYWMLARRPSARRPERKKERKIAVRPRRKPDRRTKRPFGPDAE